MANSLFTEVKFKIYPADGDDNIINIHGGIPASAVDIGSTIMLLNESIEFNF